MTYDCASSSLSAVAAASLTGLCDASGGGAAFLRMEGHLVVGHTVDSFDDVDFSVVGPVVSLGPDAGPYLQARQVMHLQ